MKLTDKTSLQDLEKKLNIKIETSEEEAYLTLNYLLKKLNVKIQNVIKKRYFEHKLLDEIANEEHLSKERIRQIILRGLRHIKYYNNKTHILDKGLDFYINNIISKTKTEIRNEMQYEYKNIENAMKYYQEVIDKFNSLNNKIDISVLPYDYMSLEIESLDFSVRTFNCLKRAGINSLFELSKLSKMQLYRIRNMGSKSINEIINKLKQYSIEIK